MYIQNFRIPIVDNATTAKPLLLLKSVVETSVSTVLLGRPCFMGISPTYPALNKAILAPADFRVNVQNCSKDGFFCFSVIYWEKVLYRHIILRRIYL